MLRFPVMQSTFNFSKQPWTLSTDETKVSKSKDHFSHKLEAKFNKLKRKNGIPLLLYINNDDIIFNYSHQVLTESEKSASA